jgi:hypothetical protein
LSTTPSLPALLLAAFFLFGGLRCGVAFHDKFEGTEFFKRMTVCDQAGRCTTGATRQYPSGTALKIDLTVTQGYPVPVEVACYYEDESHLTDDQKQVVFHERAALAAKTVLSPATEGRPNQKHLPEQHLTFDLTIVAPGDYFLACLTPASGDNGLGVGLKIR